MGLLLMASSADGVEVAVELWDAHLRWNLDGLVRRVVLLHFWQIGENGGVLCGAEVKLRRVVAS